MDDLKIGEKVKIKDTNIIGVIVQVGAKGLVRVSSSNLSAFDRTVYDPKELEKEKMEGNYEI